MKNCLLIHIGMPKTGSTAIQNFLCTNRAMLERFGWSYPDIYNMLPDAARKPHGGTWMNVKNMMSYGNAEKDINSFDWNEGIKILKEEIKRYNVILSYEGIGENENMKMYIEEFKKYFHNIKVICYIRRQDLYMESYWNQLVKGCLHYQCESRQLAEFIPGWNKIQSIDYYNKFKILDGIIGKDNIFIRIFEKEQFQGVRKDVLSDFISVLKLPEQEFEYNVPDEKSNRRICNNYLELKRLINGEWPIVTKGLYHIEEKLKEYTRENGFGKDYYMPSDQRKEILAQFEDGNRKLAKEYLNREDGRLFYDEKIDFPCYQSPFEEKDEDIIKLFSAVISRQDALIEEMQKNMEKQSRRMLHIQESLIKYLCRGRKIVYFGAGFRGQECISKLDFAVSFFLDNNKEREGEEFCNSKILHPDSIMEWENIFIIITTDKDMEIKEQLSRVGLEEEKDFISFKELL